MIYTKSQLAPSQTMGMRAISVYNQLPSNLYVDVKTTDLGVTCFVSDPMALNYVKQLFQYLPDCTKWVTV